MPGMLYPPSRAPPEALHASGALGLIASSTDGIDTKLVGVDSDFNDELEAEFDDCDDSA